VVGRRKFASQGDFDRVRNELIEALGGKPVPIRHVLTWLKEDGYDVSGLDRAGEEPPSGWRLSLELDESRNVAKSDTMRGTIGSYGEQPEGGENNGS
jgi:hypothetical protein